MPDVRVGSVRAECLDVRMFELESVDGSPLPPFSAGSHIDVHMHEGLVRQYSLCNGPEETNRYRIAVKREAVSRGGSVHMHERVNEGDVLSVSVPRNNFRLHEGDGTVLLLAGGIGITPLLSMALHLNSEGRKYRLHYFARSVQHTAFHRRLSEEDFRGRVDFHYALEPHAVRGYLRRVLWHRDPDAELYLCGPRAFMDLVEEVAAATWPPQNIHLEYFSADPGALAGPRTTFRVRLARSGGEFAIPEDKSIVQVLSDHGHSVDTSCEQGVCGTCLTGVLDGIPDHRDVFLTDDERRDNDKMCVCVSRSLSDVLVLDL